MPELLENPVPERPLRRLAPNPDGSWPDTKSWIGGQPKLGSTSWPKDDENRPLHHVASISTEEVAPFIDGKLPKEGTLAFFVGKEVGRVVHASGTTDTDMPSGLTASDFERYFGKMERTVPNRLDRFPVILTDNKTARADKELWNAWKRIEDYDKLVFWDAAYLLLFILKTALSDEKISPGIARLAELVGVKVSGLYKLKPITQFAVVPRDTVPAVQNILNAYRDWVRAIEDKVSANDRWSRMTVEDVAWLREICDHLQYSRPRHLQAFPERPKPTSFAVFVGKPIYFDSVVGRMILHILARPAPVLNELPKSLLDAVNYEPGFAPLSGAHHMFGYGHSSACFDFGVWDQQHLLQLSLNDSAIGDPSISETMYHFVIPPEELKAGNLAAANCVTWYGT